MSTEYTITTADIEALRQEAGTAGDLAQVRICDAALAGDNQAWQECGRVVAEALSAFLSSAGDEA